MLLAGLSLYCAAGALAALAPVFPLLLAARLLQALGGAAGLVCARVLVGDLFPPDEVPARQASLMADHQVALLTAQPVEMPTTVNGLLTDVTMFLLSLGPYLDLLAEAGVEAAAPPPAAAGAPGMVNTWPG